MPTKKVSLKQKAARSKLAHATKAAKAEYHKLPANMQTRSRWNDIVKKQMKKR